jgi:hypothetical protein
MIQAHTYPPETILEVRKDSEVLCEVHIRCSVGRIPSASVRPTTIVLFQKLPPNTGYEFHVGSEQQTTG